MELYKTEEFGTQFPSDNDTLPAGSIVTFTLSLVGLALSAAALALLFLTAMLFSEWRQSYKNQLLIQFMLARFLYTFVRYIHDILNALRGCNRYDCIINLDMLSMIYTEISLVIWMFIFSRQMYMSLVKVFNTDSNIWLVSVCVWTGTGVASIILHLIFYIQTDKDARYYLMYLLLIKWPVLIANAVLLILILRSILMNNSKTENNTRIIIVMIMLILMFGVQQILIDLRKIHFVIYSDSYITSTIFLGSNLATMYHCAISILFWVFGNANTRKLWRLQDLRKKLNGCFSQAKLYEV